jgi:hypothetical protein
VADRQHSRDGEAAPSHERKVALALGIDNMVDGKHILMLDYDNTSLEEVMSEAMVIKQQQSLGPFEIAKTNKGWHVFFWWDLLSDIDYEIALNFSSCDPDFKARSKKTMRIAGKYAVPDIQESIVVIEPDKDSCSKVYGEGMLRLQLVHAIARAIAFDKEKMISNG